MPLAALLILAAQAAPADVPAGLLPAGAVVIETADLRPATKRDRLLVLWMLRPTRVQRAGYCGDAVYGDHWSGRTRLSLVDTGQRKLLRTVVIEGKIGFGDADRFSLPFWVARRGYYHVPAPDAQGEGKPMLLHLRDFTGDGIAAEFAMFQYVACGVVESSVAGYDPQEDSVVLYPVEIYRAGRNVQTVLWIPQVFAREPASPGHWDFVWQPGHGADVDIHDRVSFDTKRRRFVNQQTITPFR